MFRKNKEALESIDRHKSMAKIYSNSVFHPNPEFNMLHNVKIIFNFLTGLKKKDTITSSQFTKLYASSQTLVNNERLVKHDMALVFTAVLGKLKTVMDFTDFKYAMYKLYLKSKGSKKDLTESEDINAQFTKF
eukprot:CAMPEP_0168338212 /NCGR_PEP_ID=MMETSP0213-20121227/12694_1 /TAXON_ID=151035 /ORGANISM="Euplotes harpa, Strain FSP1.4" /LENGTH=132 /DNA_ID=CAMNT_0008343935 /DNA_START=48 /DNA_END=443 /DNA_ORIENTATION=-